MVETDRYLLDTSILLLLVRGGPRNTLLINDLWIAATAYVYQLTLITTDKDFDHLKTEYCRVEYMAQ